MYQSCLNCNKIKNGTIFLSIKSIITGISYINMVECKCISRSKLDSVYCVLVCTNKSIHINNKSILISNYVICKKRNAEINKRINLQKMYIQ